jgi:diguanylate cyclase (GGDEF)-like protein
MHLTSPRPHARPDIPLYRPLSRRWAWVAVVVSLLLTYELDRVTDAAPAQHLYYLPIIFAGVRFGIRSGLGVALAATVLYHLANPHVLTFQYEQLDVLEVGVFITAGVLSATLADNARRLNWLAMTDDLTGLHNLRSFEVALQSLVRASREGRRPLTVLVLDVDRLKSLNDQHGHLAGAEAVRTVGHLIAAWTPPGAVACRYGGDEFVVALPGFGALMAGLAADQLRAAVAAAAPVLAGRRFPPSTLSVSIGLASRAFGAGWRPAADGVVDTALAEGLFREADVALYAAKTGGRNRVSSAPVPAAAVAR